MYARNVVHLPLSLVSFACSLRALPCLLWAARFFICLSAAASARRMTALMYAAQNGRNRAIDVLVRAGANIHARNSDVRASVPVGLSVCPPACVRPE